MGLGYYLWFFLPLKTDSQEEPYVNVYNWYATIPAEIIQQFEEETGIKVRYDLYDNNEILEAKLLSGNSGYDIVFPSATPYVARQIEAGVYQKINYDLVPNASHLDPFIVEQMQIVDPGLVYSLPYFWGTFGFAYVEEEIKKRLPNAPVTSYRMLFDPEIVKHFTGCGVTLLEESVDIYPVILSYLGKDPQSADPEDLKKAHEHLLKIRPYISRFSASRFVNDLVGGESCLAQAWSGEAHVANQIAQDTGKNITIKYVVPEEGGAIWIDVVAIPKTAPHPKNAHKFINFLFRSDICAKNTNETIVATANDAALPLIKEDIRANKTIFPEPRIKEKLRLDKTHSAAYEALRNRLWVQAKVGETDTKK